MSATALDPGNPLFDGSQYDLPIPTIDGHRADALRITIAGTLELDLYNPAHLEFMDALKLGQTLQLTVTAEVAGKSDTHTHTNDDEHTVHGRRLRIVAIDGPGMPH